MLPTSIDTISRHWNVFNVSHVACLSSGFSRLRFCGLNSGSISAIEKHSFDIYLTGDHAHITVAFNLVDSVNLSTDILLRNPSLTTHGVDIFLCSCSSMHKTLHSCTLYWWLSAFCTLFKKGRLYLYAICPRWNIQWDSIWKSVQEVQQVYQNSRLLFHPTLFSSSVNKHGYYTQVSSCFSAFHYVSCPSETS